MPIRNAKIGDQVVFAKEKHSGTPGQRARDVSAATKGDSYSYLVDKYWTVREVEGDGTLQLVTRRGKMHRIPADHPNLRPARFFERLFLARRFPKPQSSKSPEP
ncbi:MAG: hypothetical protein AB8B50_08120 [Pirellulaceae bacterium]